jgi:hypothetical protein
MAVSMAVNRLELSVLNAIKTNPMLVTVQDMLKKIYKHYHYSPKVLRELRTIAESLEEKSIKPTNLSGTTHLPHPNLHQQLFPSSEGYHDCSWLYQWL